MSFDFSLLSFCLYAPSKDLTVWNPPPDVMTVRSPAEVVGGERLTLSPLKIVPERR